MVDSKKIHKKNNIKINLKKISTLTNQTQIEKRMSLNNDCNLMIQKDWDGLRINCLT